MLALVAALLAFATLALWRGFPWQLALFSGASIGALVYFTVNAVRRLSEEFRRI